jgi:catechol 2,3-dioxygenase-like lactoylglutathione lyase family enzyme
MAITGIQLVSIYVNDVDRALDFYTNKLGFQKHDDGPLFEGSDVRWVTVTIPTTSIDFVLVKGHANWSPDRVGTSTGICLTVDNIIDTFKQLEANGVEITEQPNRQDWGIQAQFKDSEGNSFVVVGE